MKKEFTFALAGNPNCGKTTIFNNLTGARQKVGNWPGVTIEKKEGRLRFGQDALRVVDLPGTYSLTPFSMEEITTRDFIINEHPDIVINIIDASNLERSLFLALQIMELGRPVLFVLNMADMAEARGMRINEKKLAALLDVPVVFTVGNKNRGMNRLIEAAIQECRAFEEGKEPRVIRYGSETESCISQLESLIYETGTVTKDSLVRWHAVKLLEGDAVEKQRILEQFPEKGPRLIEAAEECRKRIFDLFQDDFEIVLTEDRYGVIAGILRETVTNTAKKRIDMSRNIDLVLTDRFLGIPVFIFFIWVMFQTTFTLGAYPMAWIESGVTILTVWLDHLLPASLFKSMLLDGVVAGIGAVIVFLPNILILFFFIALFEDTGYMARAAFLMDRVMHTAGLHGKSFIPMLMGFGCNVPAIMAARTLEHQKDRILTILMTPFMSCSARLPVYIVLAGSFFAHQAGTVIFALYAAGIILAIVSGRILRTLFFKGADAPFVMELPPYRMPMLKSLLIHMWDRSKMFLKKMGGVILVGSIIIWALSSFPRNITYSMDYEALQADVQARFSQHMTVAGPDEKLILQHELAAELKKIQTDKEQERVSKSYIGQLGHFLEPLFMPLGIAWQGGVALVTGFVAKEVVVSTMGVLYGAGDTESQALTRALKRSGMTPQSALSMMVFVLLYVPCFATVATIYKETSLKWACFNVIYTTLVAWTLSFLVYQTGMFLRG
ncbi:MAG: ferrous iron transport protein B [Desulfotignum sp.]